MDLIQIDVVSPQATQARIDLEHDLLARESASIGMPTHRAVHLGGEHDLLAPCKIGERATDDLFARAIGIDVGRIEEIDALLDRLLDERPARLFVEGPRMSTAICNAVTHASEADLRDIDTGRSKFHVAHRHTLRTLCRADTPRRSRRRP